KPYATLAAHLDQRLSASNFVALPHPAVRR
ncbi:MAG: hypothetical protein QOG03_2646, partial [Actinomycetota bacterium]|nr:hypothetical protein [Actinomycetota bacterium]